MNRTALAVTLLIGMVGCGDGKGTRYPVSGVVTYKGQPVEGAQVMFTSAAGRSGDAVTDAQGRFTLSTFGDGDGALAGEHKVTITKKVPTNPSDPYSPATDAIPPRYGAPETSGLTHRVEKGGKDARFDLTD